MKKQVSFYFGVGTLYRQTHTDTYSADAIENITTPYSLAAVIVINRYYCKKNLAAYNAF